MTLTHKSTDLALAIRDTIRTNKLTLGFDTNSFIEYGDHNNVPGGKAVTISAGTKTRDLAGVAGPGGRTENHMEVVITVYYMKIEAEVDARLAVDRLAENVEDLLHKDTTMGGLIIHGFVTQWVPGTITRDASMFRVVQLHFVGRTKTNVTL